MKPPFAATSRLATTKKTTSIQSCNTTKLLIIFSILAFTSFVLIVLHAVLVADMEFVIEQLPSFLRVTSQHNFNLFCSVNYPEAECDMPPLFLFPSTEYSGQDQQQQQSGTTVNRDPRTNHNNENKLLRDSLPFFNRKNSSRGGLHHLDLTMLPPEDANLNAPISDFFPHRRQQPHHQTDHHDDVIDVTAIERKLSRSLYFSSSSSSSSSFTFTRRKRFQSLSEWRSYCSANPIASCWKAECYAPLVKVRKTHHHRSDSTPTPPSTSSPSTIAYNMDSQSIGTGCQPSPFYSPPESFRTERKFNNNDDSVHQKELTQSRRLRSQQSNTTTSNNNDNKSDRKKYERKWGRGYASRGENTCRLRQNERLRYFTNSATNINSTNHHRRRMDDPLFEFKKRTSWMFSKWYDWSGKCVSPLVGSSSSSSSFSSSHNRRQQQQGVSRNHHPAHDEAAAVSSPLINYNVHLHKQQQREKGEEEEDIPNAGSAKRTEHHHHYNSQHAFAIRGKHSRSDGLYRLHNVCLRPNGGIMGYFPEYNKQGKRQTSFDDVLDPYTGTDDVSFITRTLQTDLTEFLMNMKHHKRLEKPADCYLDTKVILFPLDWRTDNPGHCFYRTGYSLRCIESAFGRDAMWSKENVTVAYVRVAPADRPFLHTKESLMKTNMMKYYYDILGTSWFSINGVPPNRSSLSQEEKIRVEREMYDGYSPTAEEEIEQHEPMACFKEVVIAQNARLDHQIFGFQVSHQRVAFGYGFSDSKTNFRADPNIPGAQTSFHILGPRTNRDTETLDIIDKRLRECAQLPPRRRRVRRRNPHVLFATRSRYRRISLQPYLISFIAKRALELFGTGASLEVIEHADYSFREIIQRYSDADVLIGVYGAALVWSAFMPPHAVVIEICGVFQGFNTASGIQKDLHTEYSGGSLVQQQFHISARDYWRLTRWPSGMRYPGTVAFEQIDNVVPIPLMNMLLESTACVLRQTLPLLKTIDDFACLRLPSCCNFDDHVVDSLVDSSIKDTLSWNDQIVPMMLNLRLFPRSSPYYSPRIDTLLNNREALLMFINSTKNYAIPSAPRNELATKVLFVEPCRYRSSVLAEFSALRQIFQRVETVYVAEFSLGKKFCERQENEIMKEDTHGGEEEIHSFVNDSRSNPLLQRRREARRAFRESTKIDVDWDSFFIQTCEYPCVEHGPFDVTLSDCLILSSSSKSVPSTSSVGGVDQDVSACLVDYDNNGEMLKDQIQYRKDEFKFPSATEIFTSSTNSLFGTLLSFGWTINIGNSAQFLNDDVVEGNRVERQQRHHHRLCKRETLLSAITFQKQLYLLLDNEYHRATLSWSSYSPPSSPSSLSTSRSTSTESLLSRGRQEQQQRKQQPLLVSRPSGIFAARGPVKPRVYPRHPLALVEKTIDDHEQEHEDFKENHHQSRDRQKHALAVRRKVLFPGRSTSICFAQTGALLVTDCPGSFAGNDRNRSSVDENGRQRTGGDQMSMRTSKQQQQQQQRRRRWRRQPSSFWHEKSAPAVREMFSSVVEFGFNLLVQQAIQSHTAFNTSLGEMSDYTAEGDDLKFIDRDYDLYHLS